MTKSCKQSMVGIPVPGMTRVFGTKQLGVQSNRKSQFARHLKKNGDGGISLRQQGEVLL